MSRKKILIIISSDLFIRNYLKTGAFEELEKKFECSYAVNRNVVNYKTVSEKERFAGFYGYSIMQSRKHNELLNVLMWRYKKRSKSFAYRYLRYSNISLILGCRDITLFAKNAIRFLNYNIKLNRGPVKALIFGSKILFKRYLSKILTNVPVNTELNRIITGVNPEVIVFPSSAYDPEGNDILRITSGTDTKTVFLIDNWDNLSSKTVYWKRPDFLGVWGQQSKEHAVNIQRMEPDKVFLQGTPRFDSYYKLRNEKIASHFSFPYILFVGCAIPFDETWMLRILDEIISRNSEIFQNVKIIYRPHPWRQKRFKETMFIEADFDNVLMDPQLAPAYYGTMENPGIGFQPDLDYYPSLLKNTLFVTGPLTTMLIESLIFKKRVIGLTFKDKKHFTSPYYAYKYFTHFRGIEEISFLTLCGNVSDLENVMLKTVKAAGGMDNIDAQIDNELRYFIYNDDRTYKKRLYENMRSVLEGD